MKSKKEINKEYQQAFLSIRKIVNQIDPIDLFPGVPNDEYDPEVGDILSRVSSCNTSDELILMVQMVFEKWFGEKVDQEKLLNVGQDLLNVKNKYSWLK